MSSLTHTLTHTEKCPYGISGTRSAKEEADSQRKGPKMPVQHHLKGFGTFRNQQVVRSSRITSSRKKRLPGLGAFFFLEYRILQSVQNLRLWAVFCFAFRGSEPLVSLQVSFFFSSDSP